MGRQATRIATRGPDTLRIRLRRRVLSVVRVVGTALPRFKFPGVLTRRFVTRSRSISHRVVGSLPAVDKPCLLHYAARFVLPVVFCVLAAAARTLASARFTTCRVAR